MYRRRSVCQFKVAASALSATSGPTDHHPFSEELVAANQLKYAANPPVTAANCRQRDCHRWSRSATSNINHAETVVQTVKTWNPSHPLVRATLKAVKQLTANKPPASNGAEKSRSRIRASQAVATEVVTKASQPNKLPVATIPISIGSGSMI